MVRAHWSVMAFAGACAAALASGCATSGQDGSTATGSATVSAAPLTERDHRMAWWREARFGLFIHWGVYAVPAGEWDGKPVGWIGEWIMQNGKIPSSQYEPLAAQFNPVKYDPKAWARMAREAGVKYVVITSRHHDGFCLWDSRVSDWDVMRTPMKRDLLKPLAEACRAEGIRFCLYYSIMDWHHPDYVPRRAWNDLAIAKGEPDFEGRFVPYVHAQVEEIIRAYEPSVLWFDGEWEDSWTVQHGRDLERHVRRLKPDIVINNRIGKSRNDMVGMNKPGVEAAGDFCTPEQEVPATGIPGVDWESCMTMNDTWGFKRNDHKWKSSRELIRTLIDVASKGGNFLLNVGPTAEGEVPAPSIGRLAAIGRWMKVNGEAIYGTHAGPFRRLAWGRCTAKPGVLYLHVFDWPSGGQLLVPGLRNEVRSVEVLGGGRRECRAERVEPGVLLTLPGEALSADATVVKLTIDGDPKVDHWTIQPQADGTLFLHAADADLVGPSVRLEERGGKLNIGYWTDQNARAEWKVVTKGGGFDVFIEVACADEEAGDTLRIECGGQVLEAAVPRTGGWDKFQRVKIGQIVLPDDRNSVVKIMPGPGLKGALMNLRSLDFVPRDRLLRFQIDEMF